MTILSDIMNILFTGNISNVTTEYYCAVIHYFRDFNTAPVDYVFVFYPPFYHQQIRNLMHITITICINDMQ
jgi:hypothetical protein